MGAGRPRKPRAQKIVSGTFRKDRNPGQEPEFSPPVDKQLKAPTVLNKWGKKFWNQHITMLLDSGILTEADMPVFQMMCQAWGDYCEADYDIHHRSDKTKRTVAEYRASRGYSRKAMPEVFERKESWDLFVKLAREFGMSPSSRNKIDLSRADTVDVDPVEEIFKEKHG